MGRGNVKGVESIPLPSMETQRDLYHTLANTAGPCEFIGIAINSRKVDEQTYRAEKARLEAEWNLPATDIFRDGVEPLVKAAQDMLED